MKESFYNSQYHIGEQPIRVLILNIMNTFIKLINSSPKVKNYLLDVIKLNHNLPPINFNNKHEILSKNTLPYIKDNFIFFDEVFLSYLWIITYSIVVCFHEIIYFPALDKIPYGGIENNKEIQKANLLFKYAISLFQKYNKWDLNNLPNPEYYDKKIEKYIKSTNYIYIVAVNFIIFHEYSHVICGHCDIYEKILKNGFNIKNKLRLEHEKEADIFATKIIFETIKDDKDKISKGIGIISGLTSLLLLNKYHLSETHPNPEYRIKAILENFNFENDLIWGIPCISYFLWDDLYNIDLKWNRKKKKGYKNLFYYLYSQ